MTSPKEQLTPAEEYRRIKEKRLESEELHDFESPSGMKWKLRRPNMQQFVLSGTLPMDLAAKLSSNIDKASDPEKTFAELALDDQIKTINFSRQVVRYCAVIPRIVTVPASEFEVGFDDVEPDDFNAIFAWAMSGGDAAAGLDTFRSK